MTRHQFEHEREHATRRADEAFRRRVQSLQGELLRELMAWLSQRVKTDSDGNIRLTVRNAGTISQVPRQISRFIARKGKNLVGWLVRRINDIFSLNSRYFRSFLEYPSRMDNQALQQVMLRVGVDLNKKQLIPGGYLAQVFQAQPVAAQIAGEVQKALSGGMNLANFQRQFRQVFTKGTGMLSRHFDRFARDLFFQFDRSVQNQYAQSLGLNYAVYAGTLIQTSRCFCERRVNRIFTKEEVLSWNSDQWRGKIEGGNVLVDGGGYNCRHHYSWINERLATRIAAQRGIEINSYNETGCNERKE